VYTILLMPSLPGRPGGGRAGGQVGGQLMALAPTAWEGKGEAAANPPLGCLYKQAHWTPQSWSSFWGPTHVWREQRNPIKITLNKLNDSDRGDGSIVQDRSLQCRSNAIWAFKTYLSQNNPSKRNLKLTMKKTSLEVLNIICPPQEPHKHRALLLEAMKLDG
jgi:hypothetical protein